MLAAAAAGGSSSSDSSSLIPSSPGAGIGLLPAAFFLRGVAFFVFGFGEAFVFPDLLGGEGGGGRISVCRRRGDGRREEGDQNEYKCDLDMYGIEQSRRV